VCGKINKNKINIVDFDLEVMYVVKISQDCSLIVSLLFVLEVINEHDMLLHQETLPSAVIQVRQLLHSTVFILCTSGVFYLIFDIYSRIKGCVIT